MNLLPRKWPEVTVTSPFYHWPDKEWAEKIFHNGFYYSIHVRQGGKVININDCFLPGIVPVHRIAQTYASYVDEVLKLCASCSGAICHVIEEGTGKKFCPILFADLVRPKWRVKDLV